MSDERIKRTELRKLAYAVADSVQPLLDKLEAQQAEIDALRGYVQHKYCRKGLKYKRCSCGLDDLLKDKP